MAAGDVVRVRPGETVPVDGLVLTKLDGTAKGGVAVAVVLGMGVLGHTASRVGTYARDPELREDVKRITAHVLADLARALGGRTLGLFTSLRRMLDDTTRYYHALLGREPVVLPHAEVRMAAPRRG